MFDDQDFKAKVTRDELEAMCTDLFKRIAAPVKEALDASEMTMVSNISLYFLSIKYLINNVL